MQLFDQSFQSVLTLSHCRFAVRQRVFLCSQRKTFSHQMLLLNFGQLTSTGQFPSGFIHAGGMRLGGHRRLNQESDVEGSNFDEPEILYRRSSCFDGV